MWLAVLEDSQGCWDDDPLPTDGSKADAVSNAQAMWPKIPSGHRVALYNCTFEQEIEPYACAHEWIDIRNSAVESGSMCGKCGALRAENFDQ